MSDKLTRQAEARAEAVRAALARASNPQVFKARYKVRRTNHLNADYGIQEARQKLPICAIGFAGWWISQQLTRWGYRRYTKGVVIHWWHKKVKEFKARRRRTNRRTRYEWKLGPMTFIGSIVGPPTRRRR
jgi:hypothetical protein